MLGDLLGHRLSSETIRTGRRGENEAGATADQR